MAGLTITDDEAALAASAAGRITELIEVALRERSSACVCLTGGSTPRRLYSLLADAKREWRGRINWEQTHLFWGDERHVPPENPDSNYGMAWETLVSRVPVAPSHVHPMRGELPDAHDAARDYRRQLREGFARAGRQDLTFDVMLLGLGEDGHIASIFPGSPLLERRAVKARPTDDVKPHPTNDVGRPFTGRQEDDDDDDPMVEAVWAAHLNTWRITLTPARILDARSIVMVVAGEKKANAVHAAIEGEEDVRNCPAQLLRAAAVPVEWFIDRAAAARLRAPGSPR